jgi:type I restriction enzyme S subunit
MGQSPPGATYNENGLGMPFFQGVADFNSRFPTVRIFSTSPSRIAQQDDILLSIRAPIGRVNIADQKCAIGRGLSIIRAKDKRDFRFIEYVLKWLEPTWDSIEAGGSIFGNATRDDLEGLIMPWPDQNNRERIAQILSAIDDKIELNRKMNITLEEMTKALYKSWFIDFDPVRAKIAGRGKRDKSLPNFLAQLWDMFPNRLVDSELGKIPEGWEIQTIGDLAEIVGGSTPSTTRPEFWTPKKHYWATPKDFSKLQFPVLLNTERKISDTGISEIGSGLLAPGTVLLSSRAPIGYLAINEIPVAINQGFIAMKAKPVISNLFLLFWTNAAKETILSRANGSTFMEISKSNFRTIIICSPPNTLMKHFDTLVRPLYNKIVLNEKETGALTTLRDILLPLLISGELVIRQ